MTQSPTLQMVEALGRKLKSRSAQSAAAMASDPVLLFQHFGLEPDAWQQDALRSKHPRKLFNCHRQAGKSTTASIIALHRALYTPGSLTLIISPSERQSKEMLRKVVERLPQLPVEPKLIEANTLSLEFENHARIVSLPASERTVRGFSAVGLIIEDEAGDVEDLLYRAVRPMLAVSGGDIILMGTPKGRHGHFFDAWENGGEQWERYVANANESRRITAAYLEEERRALGPQFAQEYENSFINAAEGLVYGGYDRLRNWIPELPQDNPIRPWRYMLGCDFGIVDPNAFTVLAYRDQDPIAYVVQSYRFKGEVDEAAAEVRKLDDQYHLEKVVGDLGGMGKAFESRITRHGIYIHPANKADKVGHIKLLNADLRAGKVKIVGPACSELLDEVQGLCWVHMDNGQPKEDPGAPNHATDSWLYSWRDCTAYANRPPVPAPATKEEAQRRELDAFFAKDAANQKAKAEREWWDDGVADLGGYDNE